MRRRRSVLLVVALAMTACAGDDAAPPAASTPASPTPTAPTAAPTPGPTPPTPSPAVSPTPAAACDPAEVLATVDRSVVAARLSTVVAWSPEVEGNGFAGRTVTGAEFADRLGLDCGLVAGESVEPGDERLLVAAWTGPRMAWVVQTTESPAGPYARDATVTVAVGETEGEFLDGDSRATWAGTLSSGETFVVGHVDFDLGAAAKDWLADRRPFEPTDDTLLDAERHAIAVLTSAGMREVGIAEPAQIGSEEGHVMFVSPTGQISVADVAPTGWFDPIVPRYHGGDTRQEAIEGADVRITEPGPDDRFAVAAEVGFACDDFVWLLQPPANGDTDEVLATAAAVLATAACRSR